MRWLIQQPCLHWTFLCAISYSNWSTESLNDKKINNPPHVGLALKGLTRQNVYGLHFTYQGQDPIDLLLQPKRNPSPSATSIILSCVTFKFFTFLHFWLPWPTFFYMTLTEWVSLVGMHILLKKILPYYFSPFLKFNKLLYRKLPLETVFGYQLSATSFKNEM